MILESLMGSALGGVLRIAPELLKFFDRKGERAHELAMLSREMEFARLRGEITMRQTEAAMSIAELDAMGQALREQGATAQAAGRWVAGISALVRPLVTYWFVGLYSLHKLAGMSMAREQLGNWREVLLSTWTAEDMAILSMILTFWFVGRVWDRARGA